jgi:hypothetical protein
LIVDAVLAGQPVYWHPECPEQNVPDRKSAGEIGIAAHIRRGVMPAVKHRRRDHISERAEVPVEIGVDERRMKEIQRTEPQHHVRRDTGGQQDDVDADRSQEQVTKFTLPENQPFAPAFLRLN